MSHLHGLSNGLEASREKTKRFMAWTDLVPPAGPHIHTQADTNALAVTAHGASPGLLTLLPDSSSSVSLQ